MQSSLFGVDPLDPTTYAVASIALSLVVLIASLGPAIRATRVSPVDVLRAD